MYVDLIAKLKGADFYICREKIIVTSVECAIKATTVVVVY
jgi:hypothetical protein